ncbi:cannabinoid receptor 1-like [Saccoglossus kowalevskii]|uniref:Cannabinoid receptor type 1B-like n=1 Tax=Saccoglossus kowalevskii TaxID=10224 RepID=A0ABM0MV67_SACKO|nr:PREDICTED: cannabinoid receptor type 1B-like [Saccoglossus kowalevskii]
MENPNIPANILLRAQVYVDLIGACLNSTTRPLVLFLRSYGVVTCPIQAVIATFTTFSAGYVTGLMASDRYIALSRPYTYTSLVTPLKVYILLLIVLLTATTMALLPVLGFGSYQFSVEDRVMCKSISSFINPLDKTYFIVYITNSVILLTSVIYCNVAMVRQVSKLHKLIEPASQPSSSTNGDRRVMPKLTNEVRFAATIVMLSAVFLLCWGTFMMHEIWMAATGGFSITFLQTSILLLIVNHTIDPLIYVLTRKQFRNGIAELFGCCCRRLGHVF